MVRRAMYPVVRPPSGIATYTVPQSKYAALRAVNPVRFWISAPSNSGKTVIILSWLLDIMRDRYDSSRPRRTWIPPGRP